MKVYELNPTTRTASLTQTISGSYSQFGKMLITLSCTRMLSCCCITDIFLPAYDVAISGNALIVGDPYYSSYAGRAYFYMKSGTSFT